MKANFPTTIMNMAFSLVESVATIILTPLTLLTLVGLAVATCIVNYHLRAMRKNAETSRLWTRGFRRGA